MTTCPNTDHAQGLPLGCAVCGEVTRHACPYPLAPIARWVCEYSAVHHYVIDVPMRRAPLRLVHTTQESN